MAFRITSHLLKSKPKHKPKTPLPSASASSASPSPSSSTPTTPKPPTKPPKVKSSQPSKPKTPPPSPKTRTPLDIFFSSFKGFTPKRTNPPSESWKTLVKHNKWPVNDNDHPPKKEAWDAYQKALLQEVELYFGNEDDPKAWRTLCRAVGRADAPEDAKKCQAILRNKHVNIVDLIHWGMKGGEAVKGNRVTVFESVDRLREYTLNEKKVFSQEQLIRYNGGNVVLRHLLRRLFSQ